jgi:HemY protein
MVVRLIGYGILLALLVSGAVWLADHPGSVEIEWLSWRLSTSVPVLLGALLLIAGLLFYALRLIAAIARAPGNFQARRLDKKRHRGYQALSDGLAAAAGGHARQASKLAARAEKLLNDPSLTRVLSAQTAQLTGDESAERQHYEAMRERPETALMGTRGLMELALAEGQRDRALELARESRKLAPADGALAELTFTLLMESGLLAEAQDMLAEAGKRKALSREQMARRRALVLNERARRAERDGDAKDAIAFSKQALSADGSLADAALRLARLQASQGLARQAATVLEKSWRIEPLPEIAGAYAALVPDEAPLQKLRRLEKFAALQPEAWTTQRVLGETALSAKLWGQARKHLIAAAEIRPTAGLLGSLSRLEIEEYKNQTAARAWLARVPAADPDWVCGACGHHSTSWSLSCPSCGALDRLSWESPAPAVIAAANPPPAPETE